MLCASLFPNRKGKKKYEKEGTMRKNKVGFLDVGVETVEDPRENHLYNEKIFTAQLAQ